MFCDADDWMERDLIESYLCDLKNDTSLLIGGYVEDFYKNKALYYTSKSGFSQRISVNANNFTQSFLYAFRSNHVLVQSPWAKLYKRSIIEKYLLQFDESIVCYEDFKFNLQYLLCIDGYCLVNSEKYHYNKIIGENAILKRKKNDLVDEIYAVYLSLNELFEKYKDAAFESEMRQWLFEAYRIPIIKLFSIKDYNERKDILIHLMSNKGYIDITSFSKSHSIIQTLYKLHLYRLALYATKKLLL